MGCVLVRDRQLRHCRLRYQRRCVTHPGNERPGLVRNYSRDVRPPGERVQRWTDNSDGARNAWNRVANTASDFRNEVSAYLRISVHDAACFSAILLDWLIAIGAAAQDQRRRYAGDRRAVRPMRGSILSRNAVVWPVHFPSPKALGPSALAAYLGGGRFGRRARRGRDILLFAEIAARFLPRRMRLRGGSDPHQRYAPAHGTRR